MHQLDEKIWGYACFHQVRWPTLFSTWPFGLPPPHTEKGTPLCPVYRFVRGFFSVVFQIWLHVPNQTSTCNSSTLHPLWSSQYAMRHNHREHRENLSLMCCTHVTVCQHSCELYLLQTPKLWHVKRASPNKSPQGRMSSTLMVSPVIGGCCPFCSEVTWSTPFSTTPDSGALALQPVLWWGTYHGLEHSQAQTISQILWHYTFYYCVLLCRPISIKCCNGRITPHAIISISISCNP